MKVDTMEEIMDYYWENKEQVAEDLKDALIVYAVYQQESYEGSAVVIYIKAGKMYLVSGGHCSCAGMDWVPEKTTPETIISSSGFYGNDARAIEEALEIYKGQY